MLITDEKNKCKLYYSKYIEKLANHLFTSICRTSIWTFYKFGDGRAVLLGEHINNDNKRYDIQLKGCGKTPYSRNGDGKATLGPMIREYIVSEAMSNLQNISNITYIVITTEKNK